MKRVKKKQKNHVQNQSERRNVTLPFVEHLHELRKRLFYIALSIGVWSAGAYFIQQHIVAALLKPAHSQQFIYTSVGGGIDFLFRICLYAGVVCSIPVIMFQVLKYLEPLIKKDAMGFMLWGSAVSGILAVAGMAFGYFVGLPAALHFLLHQFTTDQIHPLLTIQSYMSFVTLYMLGSALLFQGPLLLVLINRIKPLKPSKLFSLERWVILVAFVLGGIMNPSPRWQDQLLLAGPMIAAYQVGVILVWIANRRGRPAHIATLIEKDDALRAERLAKFQQAQATLRTTVASRPAVVASAQAVARPAVITAPAGLYAATTAAKPAAKPLSPGPLPRSHATIQPVRTAGRASAAYVPIRRAAPTLAAPRTVPLTQIRIEA